MTKWKWAWLGIFATAATVETLAILNHSKDDTLSENVRDVFHTGTPRGRMLWITAFGAFAAWFVVHIDTPNRVLTKGTTPRATLSP